MLRRFRRPKEDPAVLAEAERVGSQLDGTLAGRPVEVLRVPESEEVVFAVRIKPHEVRDAWWAARPLVDRLERWPVAVAGWEDELRGKDVFEPHARVAAERARSVSFDEGMKRFRDWGGITYDYERWTEEVDEALDEARARIGEDVPPREALLALERDVTVLQRRLLGWEEARAPTVVSEPGEYLDWFEPVGQPSAIAFLPTTVPEEAAAFTGFFGADFDGGRESLIAVLRGWRERYGAEVVASWGTMLQLVVARPPTDLDDAFRLAVEQDRVAIDTLMRPGVSLRDHARVLLGRHEWFLHSRP